MTTEPAVPGVVDAYALRLGGCRVLLTSPQACLDVLRAMQAAAAAAQRMGLRPPPRITSLIGVLEAELAEQHATSVDGNAEVPREPDLPSSVLPAQPADTDQAAALLGISTRQVRNLGPRLGGHKIGGTWIFDREALSAEADRRHRERTAAP